MLKEFLTPEQNRNNAIKLAHAIYQDGFIPDVIYVSLRGGSYIGNVISEYFKLVRRGQRPVFYAAVVAHSYNDLYSRNNVRIDGWTYDPEYLRNGDKVLLVDDIFDSGKTLNHLLSIIESKGVPREDIKIAVHDYKIRTFTAEQVKAQPDYYYKKIVITKPEDDHWIHYMTHELVGLTEKEIDNYYSADPEVQEILKQIIARDH
ncbi:MAG: phosphoribosyltransferase [Salinispira sp.]